MGRDKVNRGRCAIAGAVVLAASGCTTRLEVAQLNLAETAPPAGLVYYLPLGSFEIKVTRRIISCDPPPDQPRLAPAFEVKTEVSARYGPDVSHPMIIHYESLDAFTKKTSLRVAFNDDGTLKSLRNEQADKTAAVIGNIGKSMVNLAKTAIEAAAPGAYDKKPVRPCNEKTTTALADQARIKDDLAARQAGVAWLPPDRQLPEQRRIETLRGQLAELDAFLQMTQTYSVTPYFGENNNSDTDGRVPACDGATDWFKNLRASETFARRWLMKNPDGEPQGNEKSAVDKAIASTAVHLRLRPSLDDALVKANADHLAALDKGKPGPLFYRQPAPVTLSLGRPDLLLEKPIDKTPCLSIGTGSFPLPQAGVVALLPLVNEILDSNVIEAAFHPSGGLASFEYLTESQAEAASTALVSMTDTSSQIATEASGAELMGLQRRVSEAEARKKLRELGAE